MSLRPHQRPVAARLLIVLVLGVVLGITALAAPSVVRPGGLPAEQAPPRVQDPIPFDHALHDKTLKREGVACVACHPVGLRSAQGAPVQELAPPRSSCHGCHLRTFKGAPRKAPSTCATCHPARSQLVPADHGVGWLKAHGLEARARGRTCSDCHDQSACVDCHEGRGALSRTPHAPGFRATHGVQARLDPASCSSCHVEDTCTACHSTGSTPW